MTVCVCCDERRALEMPDPRLPLLRVPACGRCRDRIAVWVGWSRTYASPCFWSRPFSHVRILDRDCPKDKVRRPKVRAAAA